MKATFCCVGLTCYDIWIFPRSLWNIWACPPHPRAHRRAPWRGCVLKGKGRGARWNAAANQPRAKDFLTQRISQSQAKAAKFTAPRCAAGVSMFSSNLFWCVWKFLKKKKRKKNLENVWFLRNANNFRSCQFPLGSLLFSSADHKRWNNLLLFSSLFKARIHWEGEPGRNKEAWRWAMTFLREGTDRFLILKEAEERR